MRLVFAKSDRFFMQLRNMLDQEVMYPTPPKVCWLGEGPRVIVGCGGNLGFNRFASICHLPNFFHILTKKSTALDINGGFVVFHII